MKKSMLKKLTVVLSVLMIALLLAGCQPKAPAATATPAPATDAPAAEAPAATEAAPAAPEASPEAPAASPTTGG